jgi:hypothetical protein
MTIREKFEMLNKEIALEQEYYWTRFSGFATLYAGLFVLFSFEKHQGLLSGAAVGLGLIWMYVQAASLWYVNRLKSDFRKVSEQREFHWPKHPIFSKKFRSTTDVALLVPYGLTILWSHFLWKNLAAPCICYFVVLALIITFFFILLLIALCLPPIANKVSTPNS